MLWSWTQSKHQYLVNDKVQLFCLNWNSLKFKCVIKIFKTYVIFLLYIDAKKYYYWYRYPLQFFYWKKQNFCKILKSLLILWLFSMCPLSIIVINYKKLSNLKKNYNIFAKPRCFWVSNVSCALSKLIFFFLHLLKSYLYCHFILKQNIIISILSEFFYWVL